MKKLSFILFGLLASIGPLAAEERSQAIDTEDTTETINILITPGRDFTVRIGGVTDIDDWNGCTVDLQYQAGGEWITVDDFDDVAAAKGIYIKSAPGSAWRVVVSAGTGDPDLIIIFTGPAII